MKATILLPIELSAILGDCNVLPLSDADTEGLVMIGETPTLQVWHHPSGFIFATETYR